jgi:hypothetical protein
MPQSTGSTPQTHSMSLHTLSACLSASSSSTNRRTEATPKPYPPHPKHTSSPPPPQLPSTHIESLSGATGGGSAPAHTHTHTLTRDRAPTTLASNLGGSTPGAAFAMRRALQSAAAHVSARQTPGAREESWLTLDTRQASCAPSLTSTLASSAAFRTPQAPSTGSSPGTVRVTALSMPQRALYASASSSSSSAAGRRAKSSGVAETAEKSFCDDRVLQWQQDQERQSKLLTDTIHKLLADKARLTGQFLKSSMIFYGKYTRAPTFEFFSSHASAE